MRGWPSVPAVIAREAGHGSYRVVSTTVGHDGQPIAEPLDGPVRLPVGRDWPSAFYGDADGGLWERRLGVDRRIGDLVHLPPLLALRHSAGAPVARLVATGAVGADVAAAVGALPVPVGTTRWWLGPGVLVSEDEGRTEVAVAAPKSLAAALQALSVPVRITTTATVKIARLADAPPMPERPVGALSLAPRGPDAEGEGFVVPGRTIGQYEGRAGRQVEAFTVGKATTRWVRLGGEGPTVLSERARAWLAGCRAERDPLATAGPEALARLLERRGFAVHDGVLAAEAALGGLRFPDPQFPGEPWLSFGASSYLSPWPLGWTFRVEDVLRGLVPFVSGPGDSVYAVDAEGRLWWQEMIAMAEPMVVADTVAAWIERIVCEALAPNGTLELCGHHGAALAERLGARAVPEASDAVERWWLGAQVVVIETFDGQAVMDGEPAEDRTRVCVPKPRMRATRAVMGGFGELRRS